MVNVSFEIREFFHLNLLNHLGLRLSGRSYAVKGGICLRFFHRSQRLSEDMDLDVDSKVRAKTLENAVDSVIDSRSFQSVLVPKGIARIEARKPKQTEITQRWKFSLYLNNEVSLPTKVEFSRRQKNIFFSSGIPDRELLAYYKMSPFAAQYYDSNSMCVQKILALSSSSRFAVRDLFDLHHLIFNVIVNLESVRERIDVKEIERATNKIGSFTFGDFKEQVFPFLTETLMNLYRDKNAFEKIRNSVEEKLVQLI